MAGESQSVGSGARKQRILLVTGVLGAGKTTALRVLEDLGWEAIDNFPIRLLDRLLETQPPQESAAHGTAAPIAIGFDTRTRGFDPVRIIERVKVLSARPDLLITTLFLDCAGSELESQPLPASRPSVNCSNRCAAGPTWYFPPPTLPSTICKQRSVPSSMTTARGR